MRSVGVIALVVGAGSLVAACTSTEPTKTVSSKRSKEYFAESAYGVKASPRVSNLSSGLPRGGGRDQVGKPYKIKGKWYYPKEVPDYRNSGSASWYGDAFHGRLTANGEVYDMTHLTAAHPTMPLPSYARVTNKANGSSVVVRVNDRGPYAHGRIIDLSRRAAELLDYTHSGIAKVDVEYLGRAPLHGQDDEFLMASYKPGGAAPDPSDGLPTGVMIAMSGPTPTSAVGNAVPFPNQPRPVQAGAAAPFGSQSPAAGAVPMLPDIGPIVPERPGTGLAGRFGAEQPIAAMAYADARVSQAAQVVGAFAEAGSENDALIQALNGRYAGKVPSAGEYVAVGTYADRSSAEAIAQALAQTGRVSIETDQAGDGYSVKLASDGRFPVDDMLKAAWAHGAADAMTVRD